MQTIAEQMLLSMNIQALGILYSKLDDIDNGFVDSLFRQECIDDINSILSQYSCPIDGALLGPF